jgi:hypothetical protein
MHYVYTFTAQGINATVGINSKLVHEKKPILKSRDTIPTMLLSEKFLAVFVSKTY